MGSQNVPQVPNSTSILSLLSPLPCFAQWCPLETYIGAQILGLYLFLCLEWIVIYWGSSPKFQNVFVMGQWKEAHSKKNILSLEGTAKLINMDHHKYTRHVGVPIIFNLITLIHCFILPECDHAHYLWSFVYDYLCSI
jgi:hypothetical protein